MYYEFIIPILLHPYFISAFLINTMYFTLAFFLICFNRPDTGCGPGTANFPWETRFSKGRWKCLKLSLELNVGKNGLCNSMAGVEC